MRRSEPRPDYTPRDKLLPDSRSASPAARFHWLRLLRRAAREDPLRPSAPAVLVGREALRVLVRPSHPPARPRPALPLAPLRSLLRK
jgi:hypothetical protein